MIEIVDDYFGGLVVYLVVLVCLICVYCVQLFLMNIHQKIAAEASRTRISFVGKILGRNAGGGYDVLLTSGHTLLNVPSTYRTVWTTETTVTLEKVGAFYSIAGVGNYSAWASS